MIKDSVTLSTFLGPASGTSWLLYDSLFVIIINKFRDNHFFLLQLERSGFRSITKVVESDGL